MSKLVLFFLVVFPPLFNLALNLVNLSDVFSRQGWILNQSSNSHMLRINIFFFLWAVIKDVKFEHKIVFDEFLGFSIEFGDNKEFIFIFFVFLVYFFDVLLTLRKIVLDHTLIKKFDPCVIVIDDEKARLDIIRRKTIIFSILLFILVSINYFSLTFIATFISIDGDFFIIEATAD
jgi:hypothetical protein